MKLPDECQYAVARCAMGSNICMFGKSASSGVESMNNANHIARQKTAVDALNGILLLLKLEAERFERRFGGLRRLYGDGGYQAVRAARIAIVGLGGVGMRFSVQANLSG